MQGGAYAAKSIVKRIKTGQELPPFEYFDKGNLAVIGRAATLTTTPELALSFDASDFRHPSHCQMQGNTRNCVNRDLAMHLL
jgi:NADH dehydrogenase FAD-containing subunit